MYIPLYLGILKRSNVRLLRTTFTTTSSFHAARACACICWCQRVYDSVPRKVATLDTVQLTSSHSSLTVHSNPQPLSSQDSPGLGKHSWESPAKHHTVQRGTASSPRRAASGCGRQSCHHHQLRRLQLPRWTTLGRTKSRSLLV